MPPPSPFAVFPDSVVFVSVNELSSCPAQMYMPPPSPRVVFPDSIAFANVAELPQPTWMPPPLLYSPVTEFPVTVLFVNVAVPPRLQSGIRVAPPARTATMWARRLSSSTGRSMGRLFAIFAALAPAISCPADVRAADWPQFHGPNRDNISRETGLLKKWPEGGPKLLWTAEGCGLGFSTVAIKDGMIYTAGTFGKETCVLAFDLNDKLKWKKLNGGRWEVPKHKGWARHYDGARATPTVDDGLVYHLGELGRLAAFKAKTGEEVWSLNICTEFDAKVAFWGFAESVLIDGQKLIVSPGGKKCYIAALDKKTGKTIWTSDLKDEPPSYSSPILAEENGVRQIITMTGRNVIGVDADTGRTLWRHPHKNRFGESCLTPLYHDQHVFVSGGYNKGCELLKLSFEDKKVSVSRVWANRKAVVTSSAAEER